MSATQLDYILSPRAIRDRANQIYDLALHGKTQFAVYPDRLESAADYVLHVIRQNYPDLKIPYHARDGHLRAADSDRLEKLKSEIEGKREIARTMVDLVVVSVLLDAGAGAQWKYFESRSQKVFSRSEGLAVASYDIFVGGGFSGDTRFPFQADIAGLRKITPARLADFCQVNAMNPLVGVEGRAQLLVSLADAMERNPTIFRRGRIGDLVDYMSQVHGNAFPAAKILDFVLRVFGNIWPGRLELDGKNLGDVWKYAPLSREGEFESLIPFHKLSQWLSYSLMVPFIESDFEIYDIDELTGLAEYRNGGLFLDLGVIELREPSQASEVHTPDSELVIEWRALTIVLLDLIADHIRSRLNMNRKELPLAKVLEGGTWHAGRKIAMEKRAGGEPPLKIRSDGTVF